MEFISSTVSQVVASLIVLGLVALGGWLRHKRRLQRLRIESPPSVDRPSGPRSTVDGEWEPLPVVRKTVGLQREVTGVIRTKVIQSLATAGERGVGSDQLFCCWPGNGSIKKVEECISILFGDEYGYSIERRINDEVPGTYVYRLRR
jgi:hypothetical protein